MMKKRGKSILVIDDEPDIVEVLQMRLKLHGYEVFTAGTGALGLEKASSGKPDLIILDIAMPKMDGWQVLRALRKNERTKGIPVIMLTAQGKTTSHFEAKEMGATDYFVKPFDPAELMAFIERYI